MIFYTSWALLMTALTYVLGAVGLKALRQYAGRTGYWLMAATITAGLFAVKANPLAVAFLSLVVLMGFFSELEDLHLSFTTSAFFAVLLNTLIAGGAVALWVSHVGPKWTGTLQGSLEQLFEPLTKINPNLQINFADLMLQIPSIVLILWIVAIYLSVLLQNRLMTVPEAPKNMDSGLKMRAQLAELRLPDPFVWIFIVALLGAFGGLEMKGLEAASVNVLNVTFVLFFFQGIAVVTRFFEKLKMGSFWQVVFMILIVVHLFIFVSALGLMDYWLDFRSRMNKQTTEFKSKV